jgi:hypothetical protein
MKPTNAITKRIDTMVVSKEIERSICFFSAIYSKRKELFIKVINNHLILIKQDILHEFL